MQKFKETFHDLFHSRKFRRGGFALAVIALFLIVVVAINLIFAKLGERYPFFTIDLTKEQAFNMTQDSIDFVKGLDKDVTITVLNDEDGFTNSGSYQYSIQANSIIKQYSQYNGRIKLQYVNTSKNPAFLNNYIDQAAEANDVIVECGDRVKVVKFEDLFDLSDSYDQTTGQSYTYVRSSKAEQTMTSAILNVVSDNQVQISLLVTGSGQEEYMAANFVTMLETNNYAVVTQNIVTEDIDDESKLAIVFAPSEDYSEESVKKLEDYMSNDDRMGHSLLYFVNPQKTDTPNLDAFLTTWDLAVGDGMIAETDARMRIQNNVPYSGVSEYVDTDLQNLLKNPDLYTIVPYSRELQDLGGSRTSGGVSVLLQGSAGSVVSPPVNSEEMLSWDFTQAEPDGNIPTALLSEDYAYVNNEASDLVYGRVAVVGSYLAVDETFTASNSFNNSDYFINLTNKLTERDSEGGITIESKAVGASELTITAGPANAIGITLMVVLPVALLVTSLVIWIRRRNQ